MTDQEHTAFTPPPWHYYPRGEGFIIRSKSAQGPIAGVNGSRPIAGAEANARLIAAAPDLLAALRGLVKVNEAHNESIAKIIGKPLDWKDDYLNAARAAIAAATCEV